MEFGGDIQDLYMKVRKAYDVLKTDVTRQAYDKFGDSIGSCLNCKNDRDYILGLAWKSVPFYIIATSLILVTSVLGKADFGRYWRFMVLLLIAGVEGALLIYEDDVTAFLPVKLSRFQKIMVMHQVYYLIFAALSNVGPVFVPSDNDQETVAYGIQQLEQLANSHFNEVTSMYGVLLQPFKSEPQLVRALHRRMRRLATESTLLDKHPDLADLYQKLKTKGA